jgi:hypothetical protein
MYFLPRGRLLVRLQRHARPEGYTGGGVKEMRDRGFAL